MPQLCRTPAGDGDIPATDELGARMASALDGKAGVGSLLRALSPVLAGFYARRLGHGQPDLDDLVQEALIAVYQHRAHYDPSRPFRAWLFGIARHKMVDYLRGRRVHLRIEQVEESVASDRFEREASARLDVERLLRALPPKQANAIRDTQIAGLTSAEAASRRGIGESDVRVSVHRGVKAMRRAVHALP